MLPPTLTLFTTPGAIFLLTRNRVPRFPLHLDLSGGIELEGPEKLKPCLRSWLQPSTLAGIQNQNPERKVSLPNGTRAKTFSVAVNSIRLLQQRQACEEPELQRVAIAIGQQINQNQARPVGLLSRM